MTVTATSIITDVRTLGDLDDATSTISDSQILSAINWAHEHYFDFIVDADEGFFETSTTSSLVSNQDTLGTPPTATFRKIDLVEVIDSNGDHFPVTPLRAKKEKFQVEPSSGTISRDSTLFYYIEGNAIKIAPTPTVSSTDSIEVTFVPEPPKVNSAAATLTIPDRWAKAVTLRALSILDLRLRDGRNPGDDLKLVEDELVRSLEGRQRQEPRRVVMQEDLEALDEFYLG